MELRPVLIAMLLVAASSACRSDGGAPPVANASDQPSEPRLPPAAPTIEVEVRCTDYRPGVVTVVSRHPAETWDPILADCRPYADATCASGCCVVRCADRADREAPIEVCVEADHVVRAVVVDDDRCHG